jgi:hypothetical protein
MIKLIKIDKIKKICNRQNKRKAYIDSHDGFVGFSPKKPNRHWRNEFFGLGFTLKSHNSFGDSLKVY